MDDENKNLIDDREEATAGMDDVDSFDFARAAELMSVLEKCATIGVKATSISGLAAAALNEMNEEAKDIAKRRGDAIRELERKRDEALAAQKRAAEDEAPRKADEEQEAKDTRVRARAIPATSMPNGVQSQAPAPSKTDAVARDNMRRV